MIDLSLFVAQKQQPSPNNTHIIDPSSLTKKIGFSATFTPNKKQATILNRWVAARRIAYNQALSWSLIEQEILKNSDERWKLSRLNDYDKWFNQSKLPLGVKFGTGQFSWMKDQSNRTQQNKRSISVPGSVTQEAIKRDLKNAWQRFFKKLGDEPRFANRFQNKSFKLSNGDLKQSCLGDGRYLNYKRLGSIRLGDAIPSEYISRAKLENTTFTHVVGDKWKVSFIFSIPEDLYYKKETIKEDPKSVGVDLGVKHQATVYVDGGESYHTSFPKESIEKIEQRIRFYQRKLSRCRKFTKGKNGNEDVQSSINYKKYKKKIAELKNKQANIRKTEAHKISSELSKNHTVVMEKLKIKNMTKSTKGTKDAPGKNVAAKRGLNRSILSMGLYQLRQFTEYKCDRTGARFILVDPKYTSQTCSSCGHVDKKNRKTQSKFKCTSCGYEANADINAAKNILHKGTS